jgi:hypothetical protein
MRLHHAAFVALLIAPVLVTSLIQRREDNKSNGLLTCLSN